MNSGEVVQVACKMIALRSALINETLPSQIQMIIFPELCGSNQFELVQIILDNVLENSNYDDINFAFSEGERLADENKCYEVQCLLKRYRNTNPEVFV